MWYEIMRVSGDDEKMQKPEEMNYIIPYPHKVFYTIRQGMCNWLAYHA